MIAYRRGADFERRVRGCLEGEGWLVIRAAGSHGFCDLVALRPALHPGDALVRLIQCKMRGVRDFGPQERAGATAWLASRGKAPGRDAIRVCSRCSAGGREEAMKQVLRMELREADEIRLISAQQLAEEFRVPTVVYEWVRRGRLSCHRVGRRLLFAPDELRPWVPSLRASVLLWRESQL